MLLEFIRTRTRTRTRSRTRTRTRTRTRSRTRTRTRSRTRTRTRTRTWTKTMYIVKIWSLCKVQGTAGVVKKTTHNNLLPKSGIQRFQI